MKKSELIKLIKEVVEETSCGENMVTYEVTLDHPDVFVTFDGPDGMTKDQILNMAIEELTRKTSLYKVVKKPHR